jgi:hypothetical protein
LTLVQVEAPPVYDEQGFLRRLQDLYQQAKDAKGQMASEWKRNYRVTMNRAAPNVPNAPGTRANEVFPTIDARIGWMTDQEVMFTVTPAADPFSLYAMTTDIQAEQLEAIMNSVLRTEGWYAQIVKMLWDSAIYGAGFLKVTWDQGLEQGLGQVALKSTSPWCLYVDPYATNLDDAEYIIEVHTMSPAQIERRFPDTPKYLIEDAVITGDSDSDHIPPSQGGRPAQLRNYLGGLMTPINAGQGPTTWGQQGQAKKHITESRGVNVYECWFRENYEEEVTPGDPSMGDTETVIVDQWRVIVWSGNRILLDELAENLFHTDRHPYVRYVDVETGEFWGSPLLRDLAPCQQQMNTLLAMAQSNIIFTGNPIMVGVKGSGADRTTIRNRPGEIYDVNGGPTGGQQNKPSWIQPPNLPPAIMEMVGFWRDEIERIAGLSATQRGEVPSGRATDKQVQAGQEAGFVRVRSAQRNLELTLRKAGELVANLIVINYDTPRFMAIVGEEGQPISIRLAAQHFYAPTQDAKGKVTFAPLRFGLMVNAGSSKPTSRAARINEAVNLKKMNVVDDLYVLQAFRVSHAQAILDRKKKQEQQAAQLAQMQLAAKQAQKPPGQKQSAADRPS